MTAQKACTKCKELKDLAAFYRDRRSSDGLTQQCKKCVKAYRAAVSAHYATVDPYANPQPRRCSQCGETKLTTEFSRLNSAPDGLMYQCKVCSRAIVKAQAERNREAHLVRRRTRYQQNIEKERTRSRRYREANREKVRMRDRARRAALAPEQRRAIARRQYLRRAEQARAYSRRWYHENRDRALTFNRQYRRRKPAENVQRVNRRRARLRGAGGTYTAAEWQALCEKYGNRCLACGCDGPLTVDHVVPITRGESNSIDNLQPLCRPCNQRKGTQIIDYRP
jgi:5-methylcytosine-specific restriction endonuclease McrA